MRFELFIANRYLRAKRRQAVIGVITAISVLGVTAGVASLIVALAINNGFRQDLQQRLLGSTAHVSLLRVQNDGIPEWRPLLERISHAPHVVAASPAVYEQVLISRGARARGAVLKGMVPQYERRVSDLLKSITNGSAAELEAAPAPSAPEADASPSSLEGAQARVAALPPVILGQEMANDLGATVGSVVLVTSPQGELTPFGMSPKYVRFRVVGIFQSGFYDYDSSWVFTRMSDAQDLFGLGDVIQVIECKVDDLYHADVLASGIAATAGPGFQTTNWMQQNRALFRALRLERVVTLITIGLIVLVAALNILISLTMMVMEKTRDIAVLMSLGTRRKQIRRIFVAQGMLIGGVGTVLGLAIGYGFAWAGATYHFLSLSAEVYSIDYVPFAPRLTDGLLVAGLTLGISFLATLYPSRAASRILPAEALRYE
jgi:lipoprotein-releasing system permease protein